MRIYQHIQIESKEEQKYNMNDLPALLDCMEERAGK